MKRFLTSVAAAAGLCCARAEAAPIDLTSASRAVTYFNMPGASRDQHDRELKACILTAEEGIFGPPFSIGIGIVPDILGGAQQNYMRRANVENCMVVRGWRVIEADSAAASLRGEELNIRLSELVGSEVVDGRVLRTWNNDAFLPDTVRAGWVGMTTSPSLSIRALTFDQSFKDELKSVKHMAVVPIDKALVRATPIDKLDARAPETAVIVLTIRAAKRSWDAQLNFARTGADRYTEPPEGRLRVRALLSRNSWKMADGRLEEVIFAVVPAGRWRLSGAGDLVSFCMGAPFTEVKPGEVVFMGTYDFDVPGFGRDLSLDGARAFLERGAPGTAAALRPASWTNGEQTACMGLGMYALEFPDAPYADGYIPAGQSRLP